MKNIYIICAECQYSNTEKFKICKECFAFGAELNTHLNNHSYTTVDSRIGITTLNKEYSSLKCDTYGFGFGLIPNTCPLTEINGDSWKYFPRKYSGNVTYSKITVPYLFRIDTFDPPRRELSNSQNRQIMNYQFARSDFDIPFDGSAENLISHLDTGLDTRDQPVEFYENISYALVLAYNNRLRYFKL